MALEEGYEVSPQITQITPTELAEAISLEAFRGICIVHGPYFNEPPCPGCQPRRRPARCEPLGHTAIAEFCLRLAKKRFEKAAPNFSGKETSALERDPKEYAAKLQRLPDRIAAILGKTVALKGDAFELEDDTALVLIMNELNDLDHTLIERNANKKLARHTS